MKKYRTKNQLCLWAKYYQHTGIAVSNSANFQSCHPQSEPRLEA